MADQSHTTDASGFTRRRFLSTASAAAVGIGSSGAATLALAGDHTDAALLDLGQRHATITARINELCDKATELERIASGREPARPAATFRAEKDRELGIPAPDDARAYYDRFDVWALRKKPRTRDRRVPIYPIGESPCHPKAGQPIPDGEPIGEFMKDHHILVKSEPWPEAQARVDEIVAAYERWRSECEAIRKALGCEAHEDELDALYSDVADLERAMLTTPAGTIAGLQVKARAATWLPQERCERLGGSLIRDLLSIGGA